MIVAFAISGGPESRLVMLKLVVIVAADINQQRVRPDLRAPKRYDLGRVAIVTADIEQHRDRVIPAESDTRAGRFPQFVAVITALIEDSADAIVSSRGLREIDRLVNIVAAALIDDARAEPVAAAKCPVARIVFVIALNIDQRAL